MMILRLSGHTTSSYCYIYVKGSSSLILAEADGPSDAYPSSTNTLVRHLNKGDAVFLSCYNVADMNSYSSFSGVLIQPDDTVL